METLIAFAGLFLNLEILDRYGMRMLWGLVLTLEMVAISVAIGFPIGLGLAQARLSRNGLLSGFSYGFTTFFRGTPVLCQLFLVYYGSGQFRPFLTDMGLWPFFRDAFFCTILTFSLNTAAYQAEAMRGALMTVPKGQREAALSLGLSRWRVFWMVVWPQALLVALRPLGNELVIMVKSSAVSSLVTLYDLMGVTKFAFARSFDIAVYLYAAVLYLIVVESIRRLWMVFEKMLSRHVTA